MLFRSYELNGIAPANIKNQTPNAESQTDGLLTDIRSKAQNIVDEAGRAISEAKIKEKAQTVWDSIVDLFR